MMKQTLQVYIADNCWSCQETRRIVAEVAGQFPETQVELRDVGQDKPDDIFAVPTYVLNGRVISLGNPTREELFQTLMIDRQPINL